MLYSAAPVDLLTMLSKEFTREEVKALRVAQGIKPDLKNLICQWLNRGQVVKDNARDVYLKQ